MLRKMAVALASASALLAFSATSAFAGINDFVGTWQNNDRETSGITRVEVSRGRGGPVRVQVFGQCSPRDCDWGTVNASVYAPSAGGDLERDANVLIANFNTSFSRQTVILRLAAGGNVRYETFTDFIDRSGRTSYATQGSLRRLGIVPPRPGPGGPGGEVSLPRQDCVPFRNGSDLRVVSAGGSHRIQDGSHSIIAFPNRALADEAFSVIRGYGLQSQCFIQRPNAEMTYWLRGDNLPNRMLPGVRQDCIPVNPSNVEARNVRGSWKVVDGDSWLLDYGTNRDAAQNASATIRYYNMNRQCFVGRGGSGMMYWLSV